MLTLESLSREKVSTRIPKMMFNPMVVIRMLTLESLSCEKVSTMIPKMIYQSNGGDQDAYLGISEL